MTAKNISHVQHYITMYPPK